MNFGKRLKKVRVSRGLSQKEAAKKIGILSNRLSNYERNYRNPSIENIGKLAQFYNVSTDYLFCLIDSPDPIVSEVAKYKRVLSKADDQSIEGQIEKIICVKEVFNSLGKFEIPYLKKVDLMLESAIEELEQKKKIEEIHSLLINK